MGSDLSAAASSYGMAISRRLPSLKFGQAKGDEGEHWCEIVSV